MPGHRVPADDEILNVLGGQEFQHLDEVAIHRTEFHGRPRRKE
jgi:hypothetical protein